MRLYLGNLAYASTETSIRNFFSPRRLAEVKIMVDRETQQPRGFAFVEIPDDGEARTALELDGCELDGRHLKINEAREKSGGGGGRGRSRDHERGGRGGNSRGRDRDWGGGRD